MIASNFWMIYWLISEQYNSILYIQKKKRKFISLWRLRRPRSWYLPLEKVSHGGRLKRLIEGIRKWAKLNFLFYQKYSWNNCFIYSRRAVLHFGIPSEGFQLHTDSLRNKTDTPTPPPNMCIFVHWCMCVLDHAWLHMSWTEHSVWYLPLYSTFMCSSRECMLWGTHV